MASDGPIRRLAPKLSVFDTAMVIVSLVIGIGIFRTPALVAGATSGAVAFLAAWTIVVVTRKPTESGRAELRRRIDRACVYAREP